MNELARDINPVPLTLSQVVGVVWGDVLLFLEFFLVDVVAGSLPTQSAPFGPTNHARMGFWVLSKADSGTVLSKEIVKSQ